MVFILLWGHTELDYLTICAGVAELADALGLGPSGRTAVGVQVPPPAPFQHLSPAKPLSVYRLKTYLRNGIYYFIRIQSVIIIQIWYISRLAKRTDA